MEVEVMEERVEEEKRKRSGSQREGVKSKG